MTVLAKLLAFYSDMGYITYVFELLEEEDRNRFNTKYVMCVQFPNWDHRTLTIGEIGYLNCVEIHAGIDKWFDGKDFVPYNYNMVQFIKFIPKPKEIKYKYVID